MKDGDGNTVRIGDVVRICAVPDLSGMTPETRRESALVFEYLVGKKKRIAGVDAVGNAEITFRMRTAGKMAIHWVRLEPHLLKKTMSAKPPNHAAHITARKFAKHNR